MHSSEGAVSEGGDSLDSLSLQDFQGSASKEDKEEGAASGEEKDLTTRDVVVAIMKMNAEFERNMVELRNKWLPPRKEGFDQQAIGWNKNEQAIN